MFLRFIDNDGFWDFWKKKEFWGFLFLNGCFDFGLGKVLKRYKKQFVTVSLRYQNTPILIGWASCHAHVKLSYSMPRMRREASSEVLLLYSALGNLLLQILCPPWGNLERFSWCFTRTFWLVTCLIRYWGQLHWF